MFNESAFILRFYFSLKYKLLYTEQKKRETKRGPIIIIFFFSFLYILLDGVVRIGNM